MTNIITTAPITFRRPGQLRLKLPKLGIGTAIATIGTQAEMQLRTGDAAKSLETMDQLFLRDPNPHPGHWDIRATALLMLGRFEEAISAMSRVPQLYWYIHGTLAICYAKRGRTNEAKAEIDKLLLLRPDMTIHNYVHLEEFQRQEDLNYLAEGLRIAGLPE